MEKGDIFSDGYYKKNRLSMIAGGIWPETPTAMRIVVISTVIGTLISGLIAMSCFLSRVAENLDDMLPLIAHFFTIAVVLIGYFFFVINPGKVQGIVDHMRKDWTIIESTGAIENLTFYAKRGALGTTIYMVLMYSVSGTYPLYPLAGEIMDVIAPLNESRMKKFPIDCDFTIYGFSNSRDYYILLLWEFLVTSLLLNQVVAVDTFVMIAIEHCCGLFRAVGIMLQDIQGEIPPKQQYRIIRNAVMIHNRAITLAQTIESTFTMMYGGVLIVSTMSYSLTLLQVCTFDQKRRYQTIHCILGIILKYKHPSDCFIYVAGVFGQIIHLLSISFPGQELFDHSSQVLEEVYDCNWPDLCPGAKKLISIMLMRTMNPMTITAGGFYLLNIENFGNVIRTSLSIITLMLSVN